MTAIIGGFIPCRPVDWSPFLPDRPGTPGDNLAIEATCTLCGTAVWLDPMQQTRPPFGPVICFLCAIFAVAAQMRGRRTDGRSH